MAQLDVSDVLLDPDFFNVISIVSRVPTVNSYGEQTIAETTVSSVGVVQPASSKTIVRLPEALRTEALYEFWVKGNINVGTTNRYPDVIIFQGLRYIVKSVQDFMNYGQGFSNGVCVREGPNE